MERRNVSGGRVTLAPSTVGAALGRQRGGMQCLARSRSSVTKSIAAADQQARVAQSSSEGLEEADAGRASRSPRFTRFAAAMTGDPASQDQLFPRSQRRIRTAGRVHSGPGIQWLGIGSWALFCAALFVSLLLRPDRVSFPLGQIQPRAVVSDVRPMVDSTLRRLLPALGQEVASTAPAAAPDREATPADEETPARVEADLP
jgi:hypothetical protein